MQNDLKLRKITKRFPKFYLILAIFTHFDSFLPKNQNSRKKAFFGI